MPLIKAFNKKILILFDYLANLLKCFHYLIPHQLLANALKAI